MMQKIGAYIILLVIGAIIGASSIAYVVLNQDPPRSLFEPLQVRNVRFYTVASTDYVELTVRNSGTVDAKVDTVYIGTTSSNLVAQTSLVYDPNSQIVAAGSTLKVTITYDSMGGLRYYFKITTKEGLEIQFDDVGSLSPFIGWMETNELTVTQLTFNMAAGEVENITASVTNSGTSDATVTLIQVNGLTRTFDGSPVTILAGDSADIVIVTNWTAGNKYSINLFANDGTLIGSFTNTA